MLDPFIIVSLTVLDRSEPMKAERFSGTKWYTGLTTTDSTYREMDREDLNAHRTKHLQLPKSSNPKLTAIFGYRGLTSPFGPVLTHMVAQEQWTPAKYHFLF